MACDDYLKEEAMIKKRLARVEKELQQEKRMRRDEVAGLNAEIELWMEKYELDTTELRQHYINMADYTDIERKITE